MFASQRLLNKGSFLLKPQWTSPLFGGAIAQRGYLTDTRLLSNSNNFLVLDDQNGLRSPVLQFTADGPSLSLHGNLTLGEVEQSMKRNGTASAEVEFFGPDGTRYSKSSSIKEIMRFPFFKLRLDSWNEYHVHSPRAFKQSLLVSSAGEREFQKFSTQEYDIKDLKARSSGKLFNYIIERLEAADPAQTYTPEDVSMIIRDAMSKHGLTINSERESLIQQLELIEEVLSPLKAEVENAKEAGHNKSVRAGFSFVSIICLQFAISQYCTYVAFSWDIMEPITACVSLSDAIAGYYFWLWSGKPWDLDSLRSFFYERELAKVLKKHRINRKEFENLEASKKQILDKLMNIQ